MRSWIAFLAIFLFSPPSIAADISGTARIIDGDTIWIGQTKIRLNGIDAPETKQKCQRKNGTPYLCGEASTNTLKALIDSQSIRCEGTTYDRYKRLIATCYAGNLSLNSEMVRKGWALAYRRYSKEFVNEEAQAQTSKRGIWAGEFEVPWEWRKQKGK